MSKPARMTELLAPAGERAAAYAAFAFGADAVYTGLPRFSARAEAVNLSPEELEEIVAHAHALPRPRRVYVTLNTLIRDAELPDLIRSLALCGDCGADAVIVQDFGVARLARTHFPALRLHASTQLAIHNLEGVRAAARLGFRRVTLARELTLDEIRSIAKQAPGEVEVFLHGALCYSYSGLCLYSALLRDRSGNRGSCAYPCRDAFRPVLAPGAAPVGPGLVFSMKDLAGGGSIHDLAQAGVASLKIEGRKKSPLYVAAAVNYHRKLLDRSFKAGEQEPCAHDLRTIFSRPWTGLYLQSRANRDVIDPAATGHRGTPVGRVENAGRGFLQFRAALPLEVHDGLQIELPGETRPFGFAVEEILLSNGRRVFEAPANSLVQVPLPPESPRIPNGTELFLASSQAVKRRYRFDIPNPRDLRRRFKMDVRLVLSETRAEAAATAQADGHALAATAAIAGPFAAAKNPEAMTAALQTTFSKLGDTPFELRELSRDGPALFIPVSQLNALRRDLTTALEQALRAARERHVAKAIAALSLLNPEPCPLSPSAETPAFLLKTDQPSVLLAAFPGGDIPRVTELVVELGRETVEEIEAALSQLPARIAVRLALPMITRAWDREALTAQIRHFFDAGQRRWEAANLSALDFLPRADDLDLSADWPLYTLNSAALAELRERGFARFTASPEDTAENIALLAARHPGSLVWIVHRDPPLFISESCPHAAQQGRCPGPKTCDFTEPSFVSKAGEAVKTVNRNCRFYTLLEKPVRLPVPPKLPLIPRADFLYRAWTPDALRRALLPLP
ncbi:MAG: U32 family peptidase [Opitutae bacterium]|nr:U32 family peptidase [Opitutae bacterium]